jgi:hypothetical protein
MGTATTLHLSSLIPRFYKINPSRFSPNAHLAIPRAPLSPLRLAPARSAPESQSSAAPAAADAKEETFSILMTLSSKYNDSIVVIDSPNARYLLLDSSRKPLSCFDDLLYELWIRGPFLSEQK